MALLAVVLSACTTLELETPARALLDRITQATVYIGVRGGHGTGVLIGARSVLTVAHLFTRDTAVRVTFSNGLTIAGAMVWSSANPDLAIVTLDGPAPVVYAAVDCRPLALDQPVIVIGNPLRYRWFISRGRVATLKKVRLFKFAHVVLNVFAAPGSSGSPVFDERGRVRGIVKSGPVFRGALVQGPTVVVPAGAACAQRALTSKSART